MLSFFPPSVVGLRFENNPPLPTPTAKDLAQTARRLPILVKKSVGGSRAKSGGLHLDFLRTYFVNQIDGGSRSLNTCVFCSFCCAGAGEDTKHSCSRARGSCRCEAGGRMPNCHLW